MELSGDSKYLIIANPLIILLALNFPLLSYRNNYTRYSTLAAVILLSIRVVSSVQLTNPLLAYVVGLFECWLVIWATVLIIIYNPSQQFCKLQYVRKPTNGKEGLLSSQEVFYLTWQKFPDSVSLERFLWTVDLLINLRGIGWNYRWGSYSVPSPIYGPCWRDISDRLWKGNDSFVGPF